jgi:hypothetical protein
MLTPGMQIVLVDGAAAEIVSNPLDGVSVVARYLSSPADPSRVGRRWQSSSGARHPRQRDRARPDADRAYARAIPTPKHGARQRR